MCKLIELVGSSTAAGCFGLRSTSMMRKLFVLIALIATISGCGSDTASKAPVRGQPQTELPSPAPTSSASLRGKWRVPDDGQTVIDFSAMAIGEERPSEEMLYTCDHWTWGNRVRNYTNSGISPTTELPDLAPGSQQGIYKITGTEQTGVIQVGYLKNTGFRNDICRIMSSERYTYVVNGDVLVFTLVAPGKPYDASTMTMTRE